MFDKINEGFKKWESAQKMVKDFHTKNEQENKEIEAFRKSELIGLSDFNSYRIGLIVDEFSWFTISERLALSGMDIKDFPNTSEKKYTKLYLEWVSVKHPEIFKKFLIVMVGALEMESERKKRMGF